MVKPVIAPDMKSSEAVGYVFDFDELEEIKESAYRKVVKLAARKNICPARGLVTPA